MKQQAIILFANGTTGRSRYLVDSCFRWYENGMNTEESIVDAFDQGLAILSAECQETREDIQAARGLLTSQKAKIAEYRTNLYGKLQYERQWRALGVALSIIESQLSILNARIKTLATKPFEESEYKKAMSMKERVRLLEIAVFGYSVSDDLEGDNN